MSLPSWTRNSHGVDAGPEDDDVDPRGEGRVRTSIPTYQQTQSRRYVLTRRQMTVMSKATRAEYKDHSIFPKSTYGRVADRS